MEEYVLIERNRTSLRDDDIGVSANLIEPIAELLSIRNRCGEGGYLSAFWKMDQDLFPNGTAKLIGEVMNFIHDDELQVVESSRIRVDHISQNFSRHYDDIGLRIDAGITREKTNIRFSEHLFEIRKFLVGQGFNRRSVKTFLTLAHREKCRELPDYGLTRSGGSSDKHSPASL